MRSFTIVTLVVALIAVYLAVPVSAGCPCAIGYVCDSQNNQCNICNGGTYSLGGTQKTCTPCGPGTQSGNGAGTCSTCSAGSVPNTSNNGCSQCQAGTYTNVAGLANCIKCDPGYYQGNTGQTGCIICQCGRYQQNQGGTDCQACSSVNNLPGTTLPGATSQSQCFNSPQGSYINSATGCSTTCPAGSISNQLSASSCTTCGTGTKPNPGQTACTPTSSATRKKRGAPACPMGLSACPVMHGSKVIYDCIDTSSDLQACGGCPGDGGEDCTVFDSLASAACVRGKCQYDCPRGFNLTSTGCVRSGAVRHQRPLMAPVPSF